MTIARKVTKEDVTAVKEKKVRRFSLLPVPEKPVRPLPLDEVVNTSGRRVTVKSPVVRDNRRYGMLVTPAQSTLFKRAATLGGEAVAQSKAWNPHTDKSIGLSRIPSLTQRGKENLRSGTTSANTSTYNSSPEKSNKKHDLICLKIEKRQASVSNQRSKSRLTHRNLESLQFLAEHLMTIRDLM